MYRVTFEGTWSASDITSVYPRSAHFSPMIGVSHRFGSQFWENDGLASSGVELVAEFGENSELKTELTAARGSGNVGEDIEFSSLFNLPNSDTLEIEVTEDKPYITLISMIAPSPDWFVGVSGLPLISQGRWVQSLKVDLRPYDAGTEQGDTFSLRNQPSPDSERIFRLDQSDSPFIGRPIIGSLEFTLLPPAPEPEVGSFLPAVTNLLLSD